MDIRKFYSPILSSYDKVVQHNFVSKINVGFDKNNDNDGQVTRNREFIARDAGVDPSKMITLHQIHSDIVHVITRDNCENYLFKSRYDEERNMGDALVTNVSGIMLCIKTADCAPILVYDCGKKYIAAIHCGWRGVLSGIIDSTISTLKSLGCNNLLASIGPCIHFQSFDCTGINGLPCEFMITDMNGRKFFNLPLYCKARIESQINSMCDIVQYNTYTNPDLFFSFRRDGDKYGVQCSYIMMRN